ncbi:MAG: Dihydrolipoyllysine-residue succinyltransferase [Deltaproteobacteria bacterium]|nr:Dihydrolipoyllysine-residue succinyltransferase [Deltaproteobacteria bacterium]
MPMEVFLPRVTQTVETVRITQWLKKEGDRVQKGEILFEMEADKANVEIESPGTGILGQILLAAEESAPIGTVAALIFAEGEEVRKREIRPSGKAHPGKPVSPSAPSTPPPSPSGADIRATPLAKRMAKDLGMDLTLVRGSGPGGRIEKEDVERAAKASPRQAAPPAANGTIQRLTPKRETIAKRMIRSFTTTPHFYLSVEADLQALRVLRETLFRREGQGKPSFTALFVFLAAKTLREFPQINSSWVEGEGIEVKREINIGVAVETDAGLVVPVLKRADALSVAQIAETLMHLSQKARGNKLGVEDYTGGTFTLTNMGMLGIERFDAIINPPESAILSLGKIIEKPVVIDGGIHIRPRMDMTLSADHRVLDGAAAAKFLVRVKEFIENPTVFSAP